MSPDRAKEATRPGGRGGPVSRALELGRVLRRYGFAWFLHESGVGHWVPRRKRDREEALGLPAHVAFRRSLEELGPTAVKLGQALSTRGDVLPPDWVTELRTLQDHVSPVAFDEIRAIVEADLQRPLSEVFASFEEQPLAAASIAQVHLACLHTGEQVAVKVQRPAVRNLIESDLALLMQLARMAEARIHWAAEQRVAELMEEFAFSLRGELDFELEARNTDLLREQLAETGRATTPRVFTHASSRHVLTAERVVGFKPSDHQGLAAAGVDRATVARNFAAVMLRQILRNGCFHADPHGGNVLIGADGRIFFLDCGTLAFVPPHVRDALLYLLVALLDGNADEVMSQLTTIGMATDATDRTALRADISRQIAHYHAVSTADVTIGAILEELLHMVFRHRLLMPPVFAQMLRALILTDAECRALDSRFDFREAARSVVMNTLLRVARPRAAVMEAYRIARHLRQYALLLPEQLSAVLRRAETGTMKMRVEYDDIDRPMHRLDVMFNRLAFSMVVAAMIVAPALWMQADISRALPWWHPVNVLLAVGTTLGLWLLYSILRSGRL